MELITGILSGFKLLISMDKEIIEIVLLSLFVSLSATVISAIIATPLGILIGIKNFKLKGIIVRIIYTMMSLPPVIVGLVVYMLLSRKGPLGQFGLLFTPPAMILAQVCLITPIIAGLVYNGTKEKGAEIKRVAKSLGANPTQTLFLLIKELRINIFTAIISGYGRAISEVGAVMIVGGNIKGQTRVMTTAITMLRSMGDYQTGIAMGIVLLTISFIITSILYHYQQGE